VGYDPKYRTLEQIYGPASNLDESIRLVTRMDDLFPLTDILTVHVPKQADTLNLVNAARIAHLRPGAFVINCARGGIVDEKAVLSALDSAHLSGAAFDVFEQEPPKFPNLLFTHPKISCTPHLGGATVEAHQRIALMAARQIVGFFTKGERTHVINEI